MIYLIMKYIWRIERLFEFYYNLYYNEPKKRTRDVIWLPSLSSKSFTELYEIISDVIDGNSLKNLMRDVINMSLDEFNLHEWEEEKLDDMVAYNREQKAIKEGLEEGIKQGIEQRIGQGIELGSRQTLTNTIKEMIKNKIDIETIFKVTNKSLDEIKK